jgi:hypothetical protein
MTRADILLLNTQLERKKKISICLSGPHGQESKAKANSITLPLSGLLP